MKDIIKRIGPWPLILAAVALSVIGVGALENALAAGDGPGNVTAKAYTSGVTRGLFVKLTSAGTIDTATAATDSVVGVCRKTAAANKMTSYAPIGSWTTVTSGEAIAVGDLLTAGTGGKAFVLDAADASTQRVAAIALEAAGEADETIDVIVVVAVAGRPYLTVLCYDASIGTGYAAIQVVDAAGNAVAQRFCVRTWISTTEYGAPVAQTDFSVGAGTELREVLANGDYEAISDATGVVEMDANTAVDGTYYVMAEVDGRIYSGSIAITGN